MTDIAKIYKGSVTVTAMFYDGSVESERAIERFTITAKGVMRITRAKRCNTAALLIQVNTHYACIWLPLKVNSYIVKYPNGLIYPMAKSTFEKRFKSEVKQ